MGRLNHKGEEAIFMETVDPYRLHHLAASLPELPTYFRLSSLQLARVYFVMLFGGIRGL